MQTNFPFYSCTHYIELNISVDRHRIRAQYTSEIQLSEFIIHIKNDINECLNQRISAIFSLLAAILSPLNTFLLIMDHMTVSKVPLAMR